MADILEEKTGMDLKALSGVDYEESDNESV
jgi:hypothetical protein